MHPTLHLLTATDFPRIQRTRLDVLQVNLGYKCNQSCLHCHVNAGPNRTEMMDRPTADLVLEVMRARGIQTLDLTGGAPELSPHFRHLVRVARSLGVKVIDRCNLTILSEPDQTDLAAFLAENGVEVTASLPCYSPGNVDRQRGNGVFDRSIAGLQELNALGYGHEGSGLLLNLVYNPQGPVLPPAQGPLQADYKRELMLHFGIRFNRLFALANMPIQRFGSTLVSKGSFGGYMQLLRQSYQGANLATIMCRSLISVDYQGDLYDCDFNQMLGLRAQLGNGPRPHLRDLLLQDTLGEPIRVADHCYGCTAGQGSSCGGALVDVAAEPGAHDPGEPALQTERQAPDGHDAARTEEAAPARLGGPMTLLRRHLLCAAALAAAATVAGPWPARAQAQAFDHGHVAWTALLKAHVVLLRSGQASQVRYAALASRRGELNDYLDSLAAVSRERFANFSKAEQQAMLINAYNAHTVDLILSSYPRLKSIKDLGGVFSSPWKGKFIALLGEKLSLDDIEHGLLRKRGVYDDPRLHFAVNCASVGCPMLREEAYQAERIDAQLDEQALRFMADRTRNRWNAQRGRLELSKVFDWYGEDFRLGHRGIASLPAFAARFAEQLADAPADRERIRSEKADISFLDYDWNLNEARNELR